MSAAHPEMQAILEEQRRSPLIPAESMTIPAARAQFDAAQLAWNADLPPMHAEDLVVGGVACRHLVPEGAPAALVVFVHGGGWTFGGLDSHARFARLLARDAAVRVLIPDYRLAPEHAAPAAIDDLLAVLADLGGLAPARLAPPNSLYAAIPPARTSRWRPHSIGRLSASTSSRSYTAASRRHSTPRATPPTATAPTGSAPPGCAGIGAIGSAPRPTPGRSRCIGTSAACRRRTCSPPGSIRSWTTP